MKTKSFYAVTFIDEFDVESVSRIFQTLKAARKWKKFLGDLPYVQTARIMEGGQGGKEIN